MVIRFQARGPALASMLREQLVRQNLCVGMLGDLVVDRIEIGKSFPNPLVHGPKTSIGLPTFFVVNGQIIYTTAWIDTPAVLLRLYVTLYLTDLDRLKQAGGGQPKTDTATLPLLLRLGCFVSNGAPNLTIAFERIDLPDDTPLAGNYTVKQANSFLASVLPTPPPSPIDLVKMLQGQGIGGKDLEIVWAGLSSSQDNSVVEIRMELQPKGTGGSLDLAGWKDFYAGSGVVDLFQHNSIEHDWGLHVDKDLLAATIENQLRDAINDPKNKGKLRLNTGPSAAWLANAPGVRTKLNATAIQAVPCFFVMIDIALDVTANTVFSLDTANQKFVVDNTLDIHKEEGPLVCAAISIGLLAAIGVAIAFPAGLFLAPLAFVGGIIGVAAFADGYKPSLPPQPSCTTDPNNSLHITCRYNLDLNAPPKPCFKGTGLRKLEDVWGDNQGLLIAGSFTPPGLKDPLIDVSLTPFEWVPTGWSCSSGGGIVALGAVDVTRASGDYDFWFCGAEAVGATASEYQPYIQSVFQYCPVAVQVRIELPTWAVGSLTGPCQLLITTSGGSRLVVIDPPAQLTQEMIDSIKEAYDKWRLRTCFTLVDDWFRRTHRFNPKWAIDPASKLQAVEKLWRIGAGGLPVGERLHILEKLAHGAGAAPGAIAAGAIAAPEETTLGTGIASAAGSLMVDVVSTGDEITVVREGDATVEEKPYAIDLLQVLYTLEGTYAAGAPILSLAGCLFNASPCLLLATLEGFELYTISPLGGLRLLHAGSGLGLAGAVAWGDTLYAWDAGGRIWAANPILPNIVQLAIKGDGASSERQNGQLQISGGEGQGGILRLPIPIQAMPVAGLRAACRVGDGVVILGDDGMLRLVDETGAIRPVEQPWGRVTRIASLPVTTDSLAFEIEGGNTIVAQVRPGAMLERQASYPARPWLAGAAATGGWLIHADEKDPGLFQLYRLAGTWQLGESGLPQAGMVKNP